MKKYYLSFVLFTIIACNSDVLFIDNDNVNSECQAGMSVSQEEAIEQAIEFRNSITNTTRSNQPKTASAYAWRKDEIANQTSINSIFDANLPDTLLYIVNFEDDGGYALVSANQQIPGVVAYIEKGNFSPTQEIGDSGFKLFLNEYKKMLAMGKSRDVPELNPYVLQYQVTPLLTTEWMQYAPYNNNCPGYIVHMLAGCTAIAIGQICGYHRFPASYNGHVYEWDSIMQYTRIPYNDTTLVAARSVAELIYDIAVLVNTNFGYGSSTAYTSNVADCLDAFGYTYERLNTVTYDSIESDILNGRPVWMDGHEYNQTTGHAWVVDGLAVKSYQFHKYIGGDPSDPGNYILETRYRKYIHCNWGCSGSNDGYFIFGAFENRYDINTDQVIGNHSAFNYDIHVYRNIQPIE